MSNTVKGWLCAIAGMVTMGVSHLCYSIIIILMASMVAAVGCSAAEGALIFSITAIGSLVASLFIGSLLKVLKTKYVYVIGGILQGALLVTMGYSTNLMLVYVMAFLFGIGNKFCGAMTHQINVTNWFASGRGTISSMGTLVSGLINAIMATVTGVLSSMFGYQTYSLIAGFVLAGIIVVLGLLFVCDAPEKYGMQQIVLKEKEGKKTRTIGADSKVYETAMPISKLLRQPLLWAVLVCPFLMQFACTIYYSNQLARAGFYGPGRCADLLLRVDSEYFSDDSGAVVRRAVRCYQRSQDAHYLLRCGRGQHVPLQFDVADGSYRRHDHCLLL